MKKLCCCLEVKALKPKLLLHVCCAPCSSATLERISEEYDITLYFYNPNISDASEYKKRENELTRFLDEAPFCKNVKFVIAPYNPYEFYEIAKGLEKLPERSERCYKCYELRLDASARYAAENGFDLYTTTLSISPHKDAGWLNEIGERLGKKYGVDHLYSDFKKKDGYRRSIELSKEYNLYRQDYCGCIYSKQARKEYLENKDNAL